MKDVRISVLYDAGIPLPRGKEKVHLKVPCFSFSQYTGSQGIGGAFIFENRGTVAYALDDNGNKLIPDLFCAEIFNVSGNGFHIRGYSEELLGRKIRNFYCEWFVFTGENTC